MNGTDWRILDPDSFIARKGGREKDKEEGSCPWGKEKGAKNPPICLHFPFASERKRGKEREKKGREASFFLFLQSWVPGPTLPSL